MMQAFNKYYDNFKWIPGETPLSSWYAPVVGVIIYISIVKLGQ